jgi:uncharacterized membrane protein YedE/YeeE
MELTVHNQVLISVFVAALVMGALVTKTNFCTMGAVSDWVNMGDKGRLRAWLLAMAVAISGVLILEVSGIVSLAGDVYPPYRTSQFAWLRYVLGGLLFGVGMTLGSGCGNKTLVRIGGGNIKSLFVLMAMALSAYAMMWTEFFEIVFMGWLQPTVVDLATLGINSQKLADILGGVAGMEDTSTLHMIVAGLVVLGLLAYAFKSAEFRGSFNNILAGLVVGAAVVAAWYATGSNFEAWQEYADFADDPPSRVAIQSFTFIGPTGDLVRYLQQPMNLALVNAGIVALCGVIVGAFLYSLISRTFRIEWFVNFKDFLNHVIGGVLMGIGGVLGMGCTFGQGVTGVSTLALGSFLVLASIVFGSALTMKVQFNLMDEQGFRRALLDSLAEMRLWPRK